MVRITGIKAEVKMFGRNVMVSFDDGTCTMSNLRYEEFMALIKAAEEAKTIETPIPGQLAPPASGDQSIAAASTELGITSR